MAVSRILITGDLLRPAGDCAVSESVARIKWLEDLLAPVLAEVTDLPVRRLACEGALHISDLYANAGLTPSLDAWAEVYAGALPSALTDQLVELCQDALVISCEMPPSMALALRNAGIPFIDCMVDPHRFLSDIPLAWRSSSSAVIAAMAPFGLTPFDIRRRAAQIRAKCRWMGPLEVPENATLVLDQLPGDSAMIDPRHRRRVNWFDYRAQLRALAAEGPVVWRPHPYRQDADEMNALMGPTTRIDVNVYRVLSHDNLARVVAISSGGVTEARAFGKEGRHLLDRYDGIELCDWGTPLPVIGHWVSPHFWSAALAPLIPVREVVPVVSPEKDFFRRSINCDWDFANIDGVVVRQDVGEQRGALERRNAELERRTAALDTRNLELEDRSRDLHTRNAKLEHRAEQLDARNADIERHARRLEDRHTALEQHTQALGDRHVELERRAGSLEERNTQIEQRAVFLEARNHEVEQRAALLEERSAQVEQRATFLEERNAELERRGATLEGRNAELEQRAIALEDHSERLTQRAVHLEDRNNELERRAEILETRQRDLEGHALGVEQRNVDLERRARELDARNGELEHRAHDLETRNADVESRGRDLEAHNADIDRRRHELEARGHVLETRIQQLEQHLGELVPQQVLEQRCSDLERQCGDAAARLETVSARAEALERQLHRVSSADRARVQRLVDELVNEANDAQLRVGILGVGAHTQRLFETTNLEQVPQLFLFDNDPRSWGRELNGRCVLPPREIASLSLDAVVVSSLAFENEMVAQLEALNLPDLRVVRCYPTVN